MPSLSGEKVVIRKPHDSSKTRVQPVFRYLFKQDSTGESWLPKLLSLVGHSTLLDEGLASAPGPIEPWLSLEHTNGLERCFEFPVAPSGGFLKYLIEHPAELKWPRRSSRPLEFGDETQMVRRALLRAQVEQDRTNAQREALHQLATLGASGSERQWWAFEGFTKVDCLIETSKLVLLIEGKRTERGFAASTNWYPIRNQIVRNVESAEQIAASQGKQFAVLAIGEHARYGLPADAFAQGLPHRPQDAERLSDHYLGCITWQAASASVGLADALPNTTADVVGWYREHGIA